MRLKELSAGFRSSISFRWFRNVFSVVIFFLIAVEIIFVSSVTGNFTNTIISYIASKNDANMLSFQVSLEKNNYDLYNSGKTFFDEITSRSDMMTEIYDLSGHILLSTCGMSEGYASTIPVTDKVLTTTYKNCDTGEYLLIYTSPLVDKAGKVYGAIRYIVTLDKIRSRSFFYIVSSVVGLSIVAFLVFASGLYFIKSIVKPVNTITASAKQISHGDFSIRIEKKYDDEIGKLSDAINEMASELSKIDMLKNDFISSISHELRTPLTAIKGWNETIEMCDPATESELIFKGLNIISVETDRLATMVNELLDYSKIQSGRFSISKSRIDLLKLMTETLDVYTQRAEQAEIMISLEMPVFEPSVIGDANRIKQVYINILDNAIKHTPVGGKIDISFSKQPGAYSILIKDNGGGIKESELPFVKGRFYKGSSKKPGSGLGLSICNEIITMHGGELNIYSKEGEGTKVVITLPVLDKQEQNERDNTINE